MSKLEELEACLKANKDYHDGLKRQRDDKLRVMVIEINKTLSAEFGDAISKAFENEANARKEFEAERDRIAVEEAPSKIKFPEGTVMVKWARAWYDGHYTPTEKYKLCIFRQGDPLPGNIGKWKVPNVGDVVMRKILKDGSLSARVEEFGSGYRLLVPEGQVPEGVEVDDKYKTGGAKK